MPTNSQIIKGATIDTSSISSGLLNPEQSKQFLIQVFEATPLMGRVRRTMRRSKSGEIDKIGIAGRVIRKKIENVDSNSDGSIPQVDPETGQITGYRVKPNFSSVSYSTVDVRLPWEITEETLRENIEGESFEGTVTNLMTAAVGVDLEDLCLNGDKAVAISDEDHDFVYINDGWIKKISNGGHVYDATGATGMSIDLFYGALATLPNKYNNGKLRWIISPYRAQQWEHFLLNSAINNGGSAPESVYRNPAGIPIEISSSMPDDKILLTDPQNLIVVNTYDMKIRKTTEGKEAVMADKRFYAIHLDMDSIVEELDATVVIENIS